MGKSNRTIAGERAVEALKMFPTKPTKTIAKYLFETYPNTYTNVEHARNVLRYYRGENGERDRKAVEKAGTRINQQKENIVERLNRPVGIRTYNQPINLYSYKKIGIISDVHAPYHDEEALYKALEFLKKEGIDCLYINGDFIDFADISRHEKDKETRDIVDEIKVAKLILSDIRKMFPMISIYYKEGNHETRLERYMYTNAPKLVGLDVWQLEHILGFNKYGIIKVGAKQKACFRSLDIIHGHEFPGGGGVSPSRWLYLRSKSSAMCGHFHRTSEHIERNMKGEVSGTFTTGCLCLLEASYLPFNNWNHGFAIVQAVGDTGFRVKNYKIIEGNIE